VQLMEASACLASARHIKTEREIELLKQVANVVNVGHKELLKQTRQAGKSEFEL
jgi:Xaa-Pro aminopeptidase